MAAVPCCRARGQSATKRALGPCALPGSALGPGGGGAQMSHRMEIRGCRASKPGADALQPTAALPMADLSAALAASTQPGRRPAAPLSTRNSGILRDNLRHMLAQARGMLPCSSLATADSEIGEVLMSNEQQRQLNALLRPSQVDSLGDVEGLEWSGQIGRQDFGDPCLSGRAPRAARACR
jgi:hypothetical protein